MSGPESNMGVPLLVHQVCHPFSQARLSWWVYMTKVGITQIWSHFYLHKDPSYPHSIYSSQLSHKVNCMLNNDSSKIWIAWNSFSSKSHPVPNWFPKTKVVLHRWSLSFAPDITIHQNNNSSSYPAHLCQVLTAVWSYSFRVIPPGQFGLSTPPSSLPSLPNSSPLEQKWIVTG